MALAYQDSDWPVVDYQCFCPDPAILDPTTMQPLHARGPQPPSLAPGSYFMCLGAAQTFGRFCPDPFPSLLSRRLQLPVLNVSHGGAGPSFFLHDDAGLVRLLNAARLVVVQVMSGRSESNSLFLSRGVGHYERRSDGDHIGCDAAFDEVLASSSKDEAKRIVEETRESWKTSYRRLLTRIRSPSILFWFSNRTPAYDEGWADGREWRSRARVFGSYPQLVNEAMVRDVRSYANAYVECVSRRGMPQRLVDRYTGEPAAIADEWSSQPWTENWYYPSPEMHQDAADALEGPVRALLSHGRGGHHWWKRVRLASPFANWGTAALRRS